MLLKKNFKILSKNVAYIIFKYLYIRQSLNCNLIFHLDYEHQSRKYKIVFQADSLNKTNLHCKNENKTVKVFLLKHIYAYEFLLY